MHLLTSPTLLILSLLKDNMNALMVAFLPQFFPSVSQASLFPSSSLPSHSSFIINAYTLMHIHNQKHRHPRMSFFCRLLSLLYFCLALPLVLPSSLPPSSSSCRQLSTQAGQDPRGGFRPLQMQQQQQQQQSLERARRQQQQQAARQQERQQQQQQQQQQDGPPQKRARAGNNFNCGPAMERHIKETRGKIDRGGEQAFRDLPGIQFSRWIVLPPNPALRRPGGDPAVPQPPDRGAFQLQKLGVYLPEYIFGHMPHCPHCRSFEHVSAIGWTGKPRRVIGLSTGTLTPSATDAGALLATTPPSVQPTKPLTSACPSKTSSCLGYF